ncbi:chromosome segregation protein SMC [Nocardioides sp.]|uniref:chromosome segregation protein SMC n=1 Tax=Nocardioides sp. TaxID=35761 RepID=UPI002BA50E48|nr:chromosome segregation protein SMC [Nocardioides sp.]HXH77830.1 chromosome segregation protein SMC [Nocardioides sp.]
MYLKSLTLKGFKSFASSTTLQLEPGITCIVGPNGSGKSNVVDALAWVMGEQGAKSLRGGKMEDVIFAGTSSRPPLGRAEVQLTIDNSDGALPIEYAEVTISRTMFRNGGSEYAINGSSCRLLDVQELLSDSGIGREMHVIVGQGQLDTILHATPEDRRGFIEEAAGVLKHRKRKEKALRKLDSTDGNLTRLSDLLTEIRRQLKPLGRQAEVARRAASVQADVRDARARLMADDLVNARRALEQEMADESILLERRQQVEAAQALAREQETVLEAALRTDLPALAKAQETWFALSGLKERLRGTQSLAVERLRNAAGAAESDTVDSGRDPDELEAQAGRVREQEAEIAALVEEHRAALEAAVAGRRTAEETSVEEERRIAGLVRAAADRREGLARLHGQVNALKSRAAAADDEIGRLQAQREEALARAARAQKDFTALETRVAGLDAGEEGLDAEHEAAVAALDDVDERLSKAREEAQQADRVRAGLVARRDALEIGLNRKDGAGALLAASGSVSGLMGSVAALLSVRPLYEAAVAAALGTAADAVVVTDAEAAVDAIAHLKGDDLGRAGLLLGGGSVAAAPRARLPAGAVYALDVVEAPDEIRPAVSRLLAEFVVVDDIAAARALVRNQPQLTAVTRDGDLFGAHFAAGGSSRQPSLLEIQAAVDEAATQLQEATAATERLGFTISRFEAERHEALKRADVALAKLHESDATLAAVAEELGQHGSLARSAKGEAERLERAISTALEAHESDVAGLADLELRLTAAEESPDEEPDLTERERLVEAARGARQSEMEARLTLRTTEERARALHGRADSLLRAAQAERESRGRARERRERLIREGKAAEEVNAAVTVVLQALERSVMMAADARAAVEDSRQEREQQLLAVRTTLRDLAREHDELVNSVHRDEMARTQQKMRIEQLEERALEELGMEADGLIGDYGPETLVPFFGEVAEDEVTPEPVPFVREEQQKRLKSAERALAMLGRVNPLALEEFSAMEERHKFLSEQLEDLRRTRKDLLDIVREVDERVEQVFREAYADVEKAFDSTFSRLFPGGEGRLVLTDPDDMLNTGIEVEARPAGKRVKRLSLLSGGERSLVAVAFLVALFKARPSPFYILDEVEAALDDTNLGRLLEIYEELRENSQLLVITHQKRTMEVGDALYGVTMRGDGVSAVISQRLDRAEPA